MKLISSKMFRRAVSIADNIDIWVSKTFNLEPKHRLLVMAQDTITKRHLQKTIGTAIGTSNITEKRKNNETILE